MRFLFHVTAACLLLACSNSKSTDTRATSSALRTKAKRVMPFAARDGGFVQRSLGRNGQTAFFDQNGFALSLARGDRGWGLRASVVGARAVAPVGSMQSDTQIASYGPHASSGAYAELTWPQVLPGVDMFAAPENKGFSYRFVVAPGHASEIAMRWDGAQSISATDDRTLAITTGVGDVSITGLRAFVTENGVERDLPVRYVVRGSVVAVEVDGWSGKTPLTIDPSVMFGTYMGGVNSDYCYGVATDSSGNLFLSGTAGSPDFPSVGGFDNTISNYDAYVMKMNPATDTIVWSTFIGGSGVDESRGLAVSAAGDVYVTGFEASTDFPTTTGAYQTTHTGADDGFIAKVTTGGTLVWSTLFGGTNRERFITASTDTAGNVYVTGQAWSNNMPVLSAYQGTFGGNTDALVAKFTTAGALSWSTYFGGGGIEDGRSIKVDGGKVYVVGATNGSSALATSTAYDTSYNGNDDGFVLQLTTAGAIGWATYLGGAALDQANAVVVDGTGDLLIGGTTASSDFPETKGTKLSETTAGNTDGFITKMTSAGALKWSQYLGGAGGNDVVNGLDVNATNDIYIVGNAVSPSFPVLGAFEPTYRGGVSDAFFGKMKAGGAMAWATYLGGSMGDYGRSIAHDATGDLFIGGYTNSPDFPTPGGLDTTVGSTNQDAYIVRYRPEQSANGSTCTAAMNCASDFCVDGVCCDKACNGTCEACTATKRGTGTDGTCGPIVDGYDPDKECTAASCASSVVTRAQVCNGAGACRSDGTVSCGDFQCSATGCAASCTTDAQCISTAFCKGGVCVDKYAAGVTCGGAHECASGFCTDGVCCDKACNGACEACTTAKKGSGADGVCAAVAADTDPKDMCPTDPGYPASCKADGSCDGTGACRTYAKVGVACGATSCLEGTVSGKTCNGGGACDSTPKSCGLYTCNATGDACRATCTTDSNCAAGSFCGSTGACEVKKANGASCAAANECGSSFCTDGVCCNTACNGQCEACDMTGTCSAVTGAPHGTREKCAGDPAICGGSCDGTTRATCTYPSVTKSCGTSCTSGAETASSCDGEGACVAGKSRSCGAYACTGNACGMTCTTDGECATGYHCAGSSGMNACIPATGASHCSDDLSQSTSADGKVTKCGAYACDTSTGACRAVCGTSEECIAGNVCNLSSRQCEPPAAPESSNGGCNYGRAGGNWMLFVAIGALLRGRRFAK